MAAPYNDLENKLEAALKAQAETVSLVNRGQAAVHAGVEGDEVVLPRIVVEALAGPEAVLDTGVFEMTCRVRVYSSARDTLATHRSRLAYVRDAFMQDDLDALLSAAGTDFTCLNIQEREMLETEKVDEHWVGGLQFVAVCCGSDV